MKSYFKTPNIELIAKLVNLQLKINKAYNVLQSVASEVDAYEHNGETFTVYAANENGAVTPKLALHFIKMYKINHHCKPSWTPKIEKAANAFLKFKKEYDFLVKNEAAHIAGEQFPEKLNFSLLKYGFE